MAVYICLELVWVPTSTDICPACIKLCCALIGPVVSLEQDSMGNPTLYLSGTLSVPPFNVSSSPNPSTIPPQTLAVKWPFVWEGRCDHKSKNCSAIYFHILKGCTVSLNTGGQPGQLRIAKVYIKHFTTRKCPCPLAQTLISALCKIYNRENCRTFRAASYLNSLIYSCEDTM